MEGLIEKIERLVLLENEIGLLLKKIDYVRLANSLVKNDNEVLMSDSYLDYLEKEVLVKEEFLEKKREELISSFTLEELYAAYEKLAGISQVDDKLDKILVIFDLIDHKEMSIESGR